MSGNERKRVLFVTYFFPPSAGAAVQRTARYAKYLRDFGYEPIVLAPEERTFREDPFSMGVDHSFDKELPQDLKIYRVQPCQPFQTLKLLKKLKLLWITQFFLRPDEKLTWSLAAIAKGLQVARAENIDIICQNVGPWSTSVVGYVLKSILQKPLVYDVRDPWTQWLMGAWPTALHLRLERALEWQVLRNADGIAMLGESYRNDLLATHPQLARDKIIVIENGYDVESLPPLENMRAARPADGKFLIVHAGKFYDTWGGASRSTWSALLKRMYDSTLGRLRCIPKPVDNSMAGPTYILQALAKIRSEHPETASHFRVEFIGRTHPSVAQQIRQLGLEDIVHLSGWMEHDKCLRRMFEADMLFLPFFRNRDGSPLSCLPLKLYEYMLVGKPVFAAVTEGSVKTALTRAGTGIWAPMDDSAAMAQSLMTLYEQHANGGIPTKPDWDYIRQFDRRKLAGRLAGLLDNALGRWNKRSRTV